MLSVERSAPEKLKESKYYAFADAANSMAVGVPPPRGSFELLSVAGWGHSAYRVNYF